MKTAIVTDSTCYLPQTEIDKHHITVVPIPVILDGAVYDEGKDITTEEFYAKLKTAKTFPSTTQPPLGEMLKLYENLANEGYDTIISIHLASTISGFVNTLKGAVDEVHGAKVYVYDSQITVILMGWLVLAAAQMAEAGKDPEAILARLDDLRSTMGEYFIVNDLQNLVRGGRLSNASAFIGGMLKIKPLLTFDDQSHKIVAIEKIRSSKKAYARVETLFQQELEQVDYPIRAVVIHANDPEEAQRWLTDLQQKFPTVPFELSYFGPVVGTHLGEKAIALAWMKDFTKA
ncbi:DegV family protein [Lacticaseibacillus zeae]|uniref:DegV family protein n=1 Tax=Lacticaseibacillus zeae TaxID=57037 RepID=UPI002795F44D|nr:DegV family protein [Lacticaseibacillus sp. NCIMB 15474]WLV85259.1 DegV family protein [Lacticaseibacillus sp. NCIMB 15474]